ncbi:MAG TPA: hypothetical protein VGQ76_08490, partial [Thermoanaerobaculia bacterium]|nr:hypothetical protein [Thermoanaerobaculia bacterium]
RGSPQGNGRYEARLTAPGPYVARIRDGSSGATLNEAVTITADTERNFRLGARSLEVRVKNHNETAVPNALVTVHAGDIPIDEMIADSYGTAQFRSIASEKVRVTATHEGRMASREVALDRDATTVQIVLSDDGSLRLKVVDAVSLIPIYRLAARVTGAQGGSILRTDLVRDKDGVFVLPSFGTGPMTVVLESNGYAVRTLEGVMNSEGIQTVSLVPGARAFTVEVDLSVIRPCSIEVRGATGRPVALSARAGAGPVPFTLASAMFSGPEWGIYQVLLHDCSGQTTAKTLRLVDGGDRNVRFP